MIKTKKGAPIESQASSAPKSQGPNLIGNSRLVINLLHRRPLETVRLWLKNSNSSRKKITFFRLQFAIELLFYASP